MRAVLIAGPTASGKSVLALEKARALDGVVVNADAMQVYDILQVLTARPSASEVGAVPHFLYGTVPPSERFSTGDWLRAVQELLDGPDLAGKVPIFVGGTGLYFDALINGFAEVPAVPAAITRAIEAEILGLDRTARERLLAERDPQMAKRLQAHDPQRVARALAVLEATGRSLADYQAISRRGPLEGAELERIVLNPDRAVLRERIAERFATMLDAGAVGEVKALQALDLDPSLPAMKAIGVREITEWLEGRISREQAIELAVTATRQYAKRQRTWFRNRMSDWTWVDPLAGLDR